MNCHLSEITEFKYTSLIKNDYSRREFQMALRGFCIWTLHIYMVTLYNEYTVIHKIKVENVVTSENIIKSLD